MCKKHTFGVAACWYSLLILNSDFQLCLVSTLDLISMVNHYHYGIIFIIIIIIKTMLLYSIIYITYILMSRSGLVSQGEIRIYKR